MKKNIKRVLFVLIVVAVGFLVYHQVTKPLVVDTIEVGKKDLVKDFTEDAIITAKNTEAITPECSGEILYIVEVGKKVKEGDLLLKIDDEDDVIDDEKEKIYAKTNGVITAAYAKKGSIANAVTPVLEISGEKGKYAKCSIETSDVSLVKEGNTVTIVESIGDNTKEYKGKVKEILSCASTEISALGLKEQKVSLKIESKAFDSMLIGAKVEVVFETKKIKDTLYVPKTAVYKEEDTHYVWVVKDDKLAKNVVKLGEDFDYDYVVESGLEAGDIIVKDCNNKKLKVDKKIRVN